MEALRLREAQSAQLVGMVHEMAIRVMVSLQAGILTDAAKTQIFSLTSGIAQATDIKHAD